MSTEGSEGEIIVKGGSVKLLFDGSLYQKDSNDLKTHKHEGRKITRVLVEDESGASLFDREVNEDGWTITISTSTNG